MFTEEDSRPGAPDAVVLSDASWRRRFGADPKIVGGTLTLNDRPNTVVGVLPPGFDLPAEVELFAAFKVDDSWRNARGRWMSSVARLKPGVTLGQAQAEMDRIAAVLVKERPDFDTGWGVTVASLHADLVRDVRPALLALAGAVAFVLLIACPNVANLMLARAVARRPRLAVGPPSARARAALVRQLLTEPPSLRRRRGQLHPQDLGPGQACSRSFLGISTAGIRMNGAAVLFTAAISVLRARLRPRPRLAHVAAVLTDAQGRAASPGGRGRQRLRTTRSSSRRWRSPSCCWWARASS